VYIISKTTRLHELQYAFVAQVMESWGILNHKKIIFYDKENISFHSKCRGHGMNCTSSAILVSSDKKNMILLSEAQATTYRRCHAFEQEFILAKE
jgi:hypothetical protein